MSGKSTDSPTPARPTDAEAVARERLRAVGLRATRPRTLVYAVLREVGGHRSVDEVVEILADYQKRTNVGDGFLRLIRFVPASRQIEVRTYSPTLDKLETDENSQFVVPWEMPAACWGRQSTAAD